MAEIHTDAVLFSNDRVKGGTTNPLTRELIDLIPKLDDETQALFITEEEVLKYTNSGMKKKTLGYVNVVAMLNNKVNRAMKELNMVDTHTHRTRKYKDGFRVWILKKEVLDAR